MAKEAAKMVAKSTEKKKKKKNKKTNGPRIHVRHYKAETWAKIANELEAREGRPLLTLKEHSSVEQKNFKKKDPELQKIAPGGVHTMKSGSVAAIIEATGVLAFSGRGVLEVGCGVGNLCNHFIQLGAKFVVGMDFADVLPYVPPHFKAENPNATFIAGDFLEMKSIQRNISVVSMITGIPKLIKHLFKLFVESSHVQRIIFMIPVYADDYNDIYCDIEELFSEDKFVMSEIIKITVEGGTTRYCLTIHRRVYRQKKQRDTASSCIV